MGREARARAQDDAVQRRAIGALRAIRLELMPKRECDIPVVMLDTQGRAVQVDGKALMFKGEDGADHIVTLEPGMHLVCSVIEEPKIITLSEPGKVVELVQ